MMYKMIFCIMHIQVIDHKNAAGLKTSCNGPHGIIMFTSCGKISKAGKKVKSIIKIIYPERQSHVMLKKLKIIFFKLFCILYAIDRKVNTGYIKTHFGQ